MVRWIVLVDNWCWANNGHGAGWQLVLSSDSMKWHHRELETGARPFGAKQHVCVSLLTLTAITVSNICSTQSNERRLENN